MSKVKTFATRHVPHVLGELTRFGLVLRHVLKERQVGVESDIVGRLIAAYTGRPPTSVRRRKVHGHRCRVGTHVSSPSVYIVITRQQRRRCRVTDVLAVRLFPEYRVGHSHANDALEALLRHLSHCSKICVFDRLTQRDEVEDVILAEPGDAGDVLKLLIISTSYYGS